jgi:hypothetical protein
LGDCHHAAAVFLPHADVAWQEEAHPEFRYECPMRQLWIAGTEYDVAPKLLIEL